MARGDGRSEASPVALIASGAYTTTQTTADQVNSHGLKGGHFYINVSAVSGGSITVHIQGKDPVSVTYYDLLVSAAITTTGFTVMKLYPGVPGNPNLTANDLLPHLWRVQAFANNASSITYSISASLGT
jgi:hypothetical protein